MHTNKRKHIIPVVVMTIVSLSLLSLITGIGTASPLLLDFTPTAYVYLPFVAKQPAPTATLIPPDDLANEQSIANLLNQQRNSHGLPSLALVSELTQAARRHSRDMADHNFTSHTGSDGSNAGERMREAGYNWTTWAEIIGWGSGSNTESMVDWWMNSPGHRSIILSSYYTDFGVGYARNPGSDWGHYWTVNFGRRATQGAALPQELYICTSTSQGPSGGSSLIVYSSEPCQ
jgi:uncharacterized protein YkwD